MQPTNCPLVSTIKERCRICYTCVRECPAKAIRIADQQAQVIPERCIGCGNCVLVCSQHAKAVTSDMELIRSLLAQGGPAAACVAPSFPAEFQETDHKVLVGMIRALGFDLVTEVSFGADLVAEQYARLLRQSNGKRFIATSCPAIVGFVERYHPDSVDSLAPIVSPMIAAARALRKRHGDDLRVVFIGPCIAKKGEATSEPVQDDIDAVMTFAELREEFERREISAGNVETRDFDPPHGGFGALFPISRGMLQAANIDEDLMTGDVLTADGRAEFVEAIREFESGDLHAQLLECLACNGCIMGPGIRTKAPMFRRREHVSRYAQKRMQTLEKAAWREEVATMLDGLDLSRTYVANDQRIGVPSEDEVVQILARMGKVHPEDELNCGACGYETCRDHAIAIFKGLAESEMCLPFTIEQLRRTCAELQSSNDQLASTQEALMQSEKLASMGQLAAGIAHEVNNPLGTVLMLSHLLLEESRVDDETREDLSMIANEADRCKKIVAGLLHFARKNKVDAKRACLRELVDRFTRTLRLPSDINLEVVHEADECRADIDRDQILQVLTNLTSNAIAAMPDGGTLTIRTGAEGDRVQFAVCDTGVGIPQENRKRVFEPFFTTKEAGKGTGLGLAVTYGVVKMHRGDISLTSNTNPQAGPTGTTFVVSVPRVRAAGAVTKDPIASIAEGG